MRLNPFLDAPGIIVKMNILMETLFHVHVLKKKCVAAVENIFALNVFRILLLDVNRVMIWYAKTAVHIVYRYVIIVVVICVIIALVNIQGVLVASVLKAFKDNVTKINRILFVH